MFDSKGYAFFGLGCSNKRPRTSHTSSISQLLKSSSYCIFMNIKTDTRCNLFVSHSSWAPSSRSNSSQISSRTIWNQSRSSLTCFCTTITGFIELSWNRRLRYRNAMVLKQFAFYFCLWESRRTVSPNSCSCRGFEIASVPISSGGRHYCVIGLVIVG